MPNLLAGTSEGLMAVPGGLAKLHAVKLALGVEGGLELHRTHHLQHPLVVVALHLAHADLEVVAALDEGACRTIVVRRLLAQLAQLAVDLALLGHHLLVEWHETAGLLGGEVRLLDDVGLLLGLEGLGVEVVLRRGGGQATEQEDREEESFSERVHRL